jgi:hypothetical protein
MNKRWAIFIALVLVVTFGLMSLNFVGNITRGVGGFGDTDCYDSDDLDGIEGWNVEQGGVFGYVSVCSQTNCVYYLDYCSSDGMGKLSEMICFNGEKSQQSSVANHACWGGVSLENGACTSGACDLGNNKYCSGGSWILVGNNYGTESYCGLVDSDYYDELGTCQSGACDWVNKEHCYNGEWVTASYCGEGFCGSNTYSQNYCWCDPNDPDRSSETGYCTDGVDNDCDGDVDSADSECEGSCFPGQTSSCGDKAGVGICTAGTKTCDSYGSWGECADYYAGNETEANCEDGLDDDCDSYTDAADSDCGGTSTMSGSCTPGEIQDCGSDVGSCTAGTQYCTEDSYWSICYGASYGASGVEECNGNDDDCDGEVDEGCSCLHGEIQVCGTDVGLCEKGEQTCEYGVWGDCIGGVEPFTEVCADSQDNDCDGKIDSDDENCGGGETPVEIEPIEDSNETVVDTGREVLVDDEDDVVIDDTSEESTDSSNERDTAGGGWFWYLIPIILLLLAGAGAYLYMKKKKRPVLRSVRRPTPKAQPRVQRPVSRPAPRARPTRKSVNPLDRKLESSFKKSKSIFRK